jgi:hypothetical protein
MMFKGIIANDDSKTAKEIIERNEKWSKIDKTEPKQKQKKGNTEITNVQNRVSYNW